MFPPTPSGIQITWNLICYTAGYRRRMAPGIRGGGQHHAIGVYDRITWHFVRYIAGYHKRMAPRVRQLIAAHAAHADVAVLRDRRAIRRYLAEVAAPIPIARVASADEERA
jgi:hypothetical protein